jgi:hypothetical protein
VEQAYEISARNCMAGIKEQEENWKPQIQNTWLRTRSRPGSICDWPNEAKMYQCSRTITKFYRIGCPQSDGVKKNKYLLSKIKLNEILIIGRVWVPCYVRIKVWWSGKSGSMLSCLMHTINKVRINKMQLWNLYMWLESECPKIKGSIKKKINSFKKKLKEQTYLFHHKEVASPWTKWWRSIQNILFIAGVHLMDLKNYFLSTQCTCDWVWQCWR